MNNFNFYNKFNLWSPIQPASFTNSLSYLQHIEIMKNKINEVIENLNNGNFYARGLKPGKAIDIVGATKGSGFFNGEDPTIINTVINNSVLTANKPGLYKIFSTKVVNEEMKSGLTFLFQEQPLNNNCENDKLSWGILKINFVYNPTDADIDYNTYNIKIVDFAFEEERNLTDKLDRFMLVRRINPCNAENVMELYYRVPTKEEATECADACGPAALFTLLNIDNKEIDFNTYIKLENEGLNSTTYDGINGVITNPVINFDYDDITLEGDAIGNGLMNTRNVKVEVEVPKLIDKITVENTGDVEGEGSVVVPSIEGAENNIEITIENTFNEEAIKEKVEQYAPKSDVIPADGSAVVYLAPVSGNDDNDGLSEDTAIKSMTTLLNKGYAKELEVHLVGESPSVEGEGIIVVNGANYSKITIIDEVAILAGYSLEVNNSNVVISTELPATMPYDEILIEEDTVIDYDPATERIHINTYSFAPTMFALTEGEDETEVEEITESYYSVMPLQLTMGNIYSLSASNSTIDLQGTFTDILAGNIENCTINNSINNLNFNNNISSSKLNYDTDINLALMSGELLDSVLNFNNTSTSSTLSGLLTISAAVNNTGNIFNNNIIKANTFKSCLGNIKFRGNATTATATTFNNCDLTIQTNTSYVFSGNNNNFILDASRSVINEILEKAGYGSNNKYYSYYAIKSSANAQPSISYATPDYPGVVKVDGETITISNGVISAVAGGEVVVEDGVGFVPVSNNAVELYVNFSEGDDSNDGLTAETPLKTIEKALNKRVSKYIKLHLINPFFSLDGSTNNDFVYIIGDGYDKIEVVEWSGTTGTTSLNIFNTDFVWNVAFEIKLNKVINSKVSFVYNQTVKNIVLLEANNSTFTNNYDVRITLKELDNIYNCVFNGYLNFDSGTIYNSSIFTKLDTTVNGTDFYNCYIPIIRVINTSNSTFFIGCDIGNMTVDSDSTKSITIQDSTVAYLMNNLNTTLKINLIRSSINIVDNFDNIEEFYAYVAAAFTIQSQKAVINGINFKYNEPKKNNFIATTNSAGFVKPDGQSILIDAEGVIYASGTAELPIATTEVLGGVKVGSGLSITEAGVLSTTGEISGDVNLIPHNETEITYYVSGIDGNDETNTGLTPDSPLMTLSGALNKHSSRIIKIIFDGTLPQDNSITETYIDGFGYRRITLNYVSYGFEDLESPNKYGPALYVKNAGLTLNILPRTLRALNSYVVATHTDGQPSHTPYNITIENSILQLNDFESLDSVENDYIDKFIVRNSKVDFTYNGKNQSNPNDYNFIIRYGVIENSIIDTTNVQLDFLHSAETEHYISGSTIRGCVIDFNKQADVSGEDKYLYMNNTSVLLKNSALDSTPAISITKCALSNCTIANSGYNVNSANTTILNSYLTNCNLDITLDNNSVSNTLKGCKITGVINNTISHSWVLNTTAIDCDFRVSVPYSGLVSALTLTRCNYVGTELTDENWTLENSVINGSNKTTTESN